MAKHYYANVEEEGAYLYYVRYAYDPDKLCYAVTSLTEIYNNSETAIYIGFPLNEWMLHETLYGAHRFNIDIIKAKAQGALMVLSEMYALYESIDGNTYELNELIEATPKLVVQYG